MNTITNEMKSAMAQAIYNAMIEAHNAGDTATKNALLVLLDNEALDFDETPAPINNVNLANLGHKGDAEDRLLAKAERMTMDY